MRRRTGIERAIVTLGILMVCVGLWAVLFPKKLVITHQGYRRSSRSYTTEVANERMVRFYGGFAIPAGVALIWLAFYPRNR